jgi:ribonuclease HI
MEKSIAAHADNSSLYSNLNDNAVMIYTDGACKGNPGPGGWGAVIIKNNDTPIEISGSEKNTTNNRMELMAAIRSLEQLTSPSLIEIYTDSLYLKNGIMHWINNWRKNNWKNSENKPIKNKELWERLLALTARHKISWKWIKGHDGDRFNERADILAKSRCSAVR